MKFKYGLKLYAFITAVLFLTPYLIAAVPPGRGFMGASQHNGVIRFTGPGRYVSQPFQPEKGKRSRLNISLEKPESTNLTVTVQTSKDGFTTLLDSDKIKIQGTGFYKINLNPESLNRKEVSYRYVIRSDGPATVKHLNLAGPDFSTIYLIIGLLLLTVTGAVLIAWIYRGKIGKLKQAFS